MPAQLNPRTGATEIAVAPWAQEFCRWTKQFETWTIELLLHTRRISDGSRLLRLSWDSCDKMMERPVGTVWRGAPLLN